MTSYVTPKKNSAFIFYVGLPSIANPYQFMVNPTLVAGDFNVSKDGGAQANLITTPVVAPAGSNQVKIALAAGEMNGDNITIVCSDTGGLWKDVLINIQTTSQQIDDLATPTFKKNKALPDFEFVMTDSTTHAAKTGLTVTAQRSLDGGALGSCTNSVSELSNGIYVINLSAADMNAGVVTLRFTATAADDRDITIVTQP